MNDSQRQPKLGRGLDALIGSISIPSTENANSLTDSVIKVSIERIKPGPHQPRMAVDAEAIEELSNSIRIHGVIQPILVRESNSSGSYEIIAGERRWRAAQMAALHEVPVIIKDVSDQNAMAIALIENIQREDLNPVEEASLLKRLVDEFMLSHKEVAESVGKSRATVTNLLRLLTLTEPVLEMLKTRQIEIGHAKVLLGLDGQDQIDAASVVVSKSLNVRRTESLVKNWHRNKNSKDNQGVKSDPDITRLELSVSDTVDAKVSISDNNGRGFIKISYNNLDHLDGILDRMNVNRVSS